MSLELTREWPGFTQEGYLMYEKATQHIRDALARGHTYDQACATLRGLAASARTFISADFLNIIVAEEHLGNGIPLNDLAFALGLPQERLETAVANLLQEIGRAAAMTAQPRHGIPFSGSALTH